MNKFINRCRYCGMAFENVEELWMHEICCDKLTEIKVKIKDEELKRHIELIEAFREVQKQEFYKLIDEIEKTLG